MAADSPTDGQGASPDEIEIVREWHGDVLHIRPAGQMLTDREVNASEAALFDAILRAPDVKGVVLELHDTTFVSSRGIGMLVNLRNRALARGAETALVGVRAEVRPIFSMMKLETVFRIVSSVDELPAQMRG